MTGAEAVAHAERGELGAMLIAEPISIIAAFAEVVWLQYALTGTLPGEVLNVKKENR